MEWDDIPEALRAPLVKLAGFRLSEVHWNILDESGAGAALDAVEAYLDEHHRCEALTFRGSRDPDSPAFGPDEQCEERAEVDSSYCAEHAGETDA